MSKQQLPQLPPMPPMPQTPLTGSCQCGALRYRITETPLTLYCCHCSECQAQASSAFGMSLRIPASGIELLGEYGSFVRDPGKSNAVEGVFCHRLRIAGGTPGQGRRREFKRQGWNTGR